MSYPENIPLIPRPAAGTFLVDLLFEHGFCSSRVEGQQLIYQGAVKFEGEQVLDPDFAIKTPAEGMVLQVGKKRFLQFM
jgi:tyrosyl-tRNA synthetase